jgi:hypothetical protein
MALWSVGWRPRSVVGSLVEGRDVGQAGTEYAVMVRR